MWLCYCKLAMRVCKILNGYNISMVISSLQQMDQRFEIRNRTIFIVSQLYAGNTELAVLPKNLVNAYRIPSSSLSPKPKWPSYNWNGFAIIMIDGVYWLQLEDIEMMIRAPTSCWVWLGKGHYGPRNSHQCQLIVICAIHRNISDS